MKNLLLKIFYSAYYKLSFACNDKSENRSTDNEKMKLI